MLKLEGAATLMKNDIKFLFPETIDFEQLKSFSALSIFSNEAVDFLDSLSKELMQYKNYPDIISLAFFCRKSNILQLKKNYDKLQFGRGLVFHITPSNMPINFAYSLITGILSGNINIVKIPSKEFEQIGIIVKAIQDIKDNHKEITDRIFLINYDKASEATSYLSSLCDIRVIWGGDETINQIRKSPIQPRSFDVTFADRYSVCIINANEFIKYDKKEELIKSFYNDTFLFDQNSCSSPHLIVWYGEDKENAKNIFWNLLNDFVNKNYKNISQIIAVDKLSNFCEQAIKLNIRNVIHNTNSLWRVQLESLNQGIEDFTCSSGYFVEYDTDSLEEIFSIVNKKFQTLTYFGFEKEELLDPIKNNKPRGIDRVVPIGQANNFSLIWDGYDLINTLSRIID